MKATLIVIAAAMLSLQAAAYNPGHDPEKYCVRIQDGKTIVEYRGAPITSDITLLDGTKIKPDGTVTRTDGSTLVLKDGECINKDSVLDLNRSRDREKEPENKMDEFGEDQWKNPKDTLR